MNNNGFKDTKASANQSSLDYVEISSTLNKVNARIEALSIVVNILNSFLQVVQSSDNSLSPEVIASLQKAINQENEITNKMFMNISSEINSQEMPEELLSKSESTEASVPKDMEIKDA